MEFFNQREDELLKERMKRVFDAINEAVQAIEDLCPDSAERTLAMNKAIEMKSWAELSLKSNPECRYESISVEELMRKRLRQATY